LDNISLDNSNSYDTDDDIENDDEYDYDDIIQTNSVNLFSTDQVNINHADFQDINVGNANSNVYLQNCNFAGFDVGNVNGDIYFGDIDLEQIDLKSLIASAISGYDSDKFTDDDVFERVMAELQKNINQMLPGIIENIKNEIKNEYQNKLNALTTRIDKLENSLAKPAATSVTPSVPSSAILQKSYVRNGFKYGDWIFYNNEDNANFLYKVKKDGSQNTQLTNYSILENLISIRDGYLYVLDSIGNERQIKL